MLRSVLFLRSTSIVTIFAMLLMACGVDGGGMVQSAPVSSIEQQTREMEPVVRSAFQKYLDGRTAEWTADEFSFLSVGVNGALVNPNQLDENTRATMVDLQQALVAYQNANPEKQISDIGQRRQALTGAVAAVIASVIVVVGAAIGFGVRCYMGAMDCGYDVVRYIERCSEDDNITWECCAYSATRAATQCRWSCGNTRPDYANFQNCD